MRYVITDQCNEREEIATEVTEPQQAHGRDLTKGSIPRLLLMFALPLLLGNLIQAAYSMVNRIWVGQFLHTDAFAAVTNTMQVTFILVALANGLTLGSSILISQFVGAKNWDGVRKVVQTSIPLLAVLSIVLMILGEIYAAPMLRIIKTPPESFILALNFMRIFLLSFPLIFIAILTTFMLRGVGDSVTPLIFQAVGVVINAILDPLLMLGLLGLPRLGLNGAAYATLIAQSITIVAFFVYLQRKNHIVSPDWRHLQFDRQIGMLILKIGLPAGAQQLLVAVGTSIMLLFVNQYGKDASAGFGASTQIDMVAFFVAMSFSMAISNIAGQNIGAKKFERVKAIFWYGVLITGGISLGITVIAISFPHMLMRLFINPSHDLHDLHAFNIGVGYLRIVSVSYVLTAVMFVALGIVNGAGHTLMSTLVTIFGLWMVRIPLAWYLSHSMHRVEGIWYALASSFLVSMAVSLIYFASGRWRKPVIHHERPLQISTEAAT